MSSITGINKLMAQLSAIGGNVDSTMLIALEFCGKFVEDDARMNVPVITHDLEISIHHKTEKVGNKIRSTVYSNSDHASYVEFGTGQRGEETNSSPNVDISFHQDWSGMPAQPYLYPALKNNEDQLRKYIASSLEKEIKKVAKK